MGWAGGVACSNDLKCLTRLGGRILLPLPRPEIIVAGVGVGRTVRSNLPPKCEPREVEASLILRGATLGNSRTSYAYRDAAIMSRETNHSGTLERVTINCLVSVKTVMDKLFTSFLARPGSSRSLPPGTVHFGVMLIRHRHRRDKFRSPIEC
jgi:hypothetical protein